MLLKSDERFVARRLKLRDLDILGTVAQCGSMGKAATRLSVSQPTITKAIADLEHVLGVPLLDRGSQGVTLTIYGRAVLNRSLAAFDELKQSVKDIEHLADPTAGELRIGASIVIASGFVTEAVDRLSRRHPRIRFELITGEAAHTYRALTERKFDLLIARVFAPMTEDAMNVEHLYQESHFVVVGAQNPWARRRRIQLADLMNEPWALPSADSAYGAICIEAFRHAGLDPPRATVVTYTNPVRNALVARGRFFTVMPESAIRFSPDNPALKALPIDLPTARWPVALITLKNRALSPVAKLFIDCVRSTAKSLSDRK